MYVNLRKYFESQNQHEPAEYMLLDTLVRACRRYAREAERAGAAQADKEAAQRRQELLDEELTAPRRARPRIALPWIGDYSAQISESVVVLFLQVAVCSGGS